MKKSRPAISPPDSKELAASIKKWLTGWPSSYSADSDRWIVARLRGLSGFESIADFYSFYEHAIWPTLDRLKREGASVDRMAEEATALLLKPLPLQQFRFSAPFSCGHTSLPFHAAIARVANFYGIDKAWSLSLENGDHDDLGKCLLLSGMIDARWWTEALQIVEGLVEAILGTCVALSFADYLPSHGVHQQMSVDLTPGAIEAESALSPRFSHVVANTRFVPTEGEILWECNPNPLFDERPEKRCDAVALVACSTETTGARIRRASQFFLRGVAATTLGEAATYYALCLETLLLEDSSSDIGARLKEAVAYSLGRSPESREACRRATCNLYDARSRYIHTGEMTATFADSLQWRTVCEDVLRHEMMMYLTVRNENDYELLR